MNKIDLTTISGSQIFVELSDCGALWEPALLNSSSIKSNHIRIYQHPDYWIMNIEGKLVLPVGLTVIFMTRWGVDLTGVSVGDGISYLEGITPSYLPFENDKTPSKIDIIAVQVIGPAEGWSY